MLYNNKKMEGKIMAKKIYLIRWFDGIKETKEIYEGRTPDDVKYMLKLSSTSLGFPRNREGWGLLNVSALLSQEAQYVRGK